MNIEEIAEVKNKRKSPNKITHKRLKEILKYDPLTGQFINLTTRGPRAMAGKVAGCINPNGYRQIKMDKKRYLEHVVAYFYMEGHWPEDRKDGRFLIDHEDQNPSNNRWSNLRACTPKENAANRSLNKNNISGYIGVLQIPSGNWRASMTVDGKSVNIGTYPTAKLAANGYDNAKKKLHPEFAFTNEMMKTNISIAA